MVKLLWNLEGLNKNLIYYNFKKLKEDPTENIHEDMAVKQNAWKSKSV